MRNLISIDFEYTQAAPSTFLAGGAVKYDSKTTKITKYGFADIRECYGWLTREPPAYVYAHNASRAEWLCLAEQIGKRGGLRQGILTGSTLLKFWDPPHFYIDSIRLLPGEVEEFGPKLDPPMEKVPLDYEHVQDYLVATLIGAAINHAEIVLRILLAFAEDFGMEPCKLPLTVGSHALKDLLKTNNLRLPDIEKLIADYAKLSIYGGRSEMFFDGVVDHVRLYDINSSYPYAAQEGLLPWNNPIEEKDLWKCHMVEVTVEAPPMKYPILPFRIAQDKENGDHGLFFPTGTWQAWFSTNELKYAVENGYKIHKFHHGYKFCEVDLSKWFNRQYNRRKEPLGVGSIIGKLMGNGVIGKFQQHKKGKTITRMGWEDNKPLITSHPSAPKISKLYHTAAWILAGARINLHQLLVESDSLNTDTDCTFTQKNLDKRCIKDKLGAIKLEKVGKCEFLAPKVYKMIPECKEEETIIKLKGVYRRAKNIEDIFDNREGTFTRPATLMEMHEGNNNLDSIMINKDFHLALGRHKRNFADDGTSTPWSVKELKNGDYKHTRKYKKLRNKINGVFNSQLNSFNSI